MSVRPPTQATSFSTGVPPRTQSAPPTNSTQPAGRGSLNATAQPFQPPPQNQNQNYSQPNPTLNPNINSMYTPQAPPYYPNDLAYPYPHQMHHYQYHQQYPYYPQTPAQNIHHHHHHVRGLMPHMHTYMHQPHHHHHHQSHLQHSHPPSHQHQQHHQHHHHQHHAQQKPDDSPKRQSNIWNVQSDLSGVRPVESPKTNQDNEEDSEVQSSEDTPQEENNQTAKQIQRTQQGNKKTYSVDFLLKFQNEQTNPPEKIKLFSEIYMPNADDNLPSPQRNRAGVSKKTKPSGSPTTTTPPQPSISSPLQGMNPTIQRYPPVQNNATPPPYYTKHQPITEYSHRAPDPYKPISPTEEIQTVAKKVVGILNRLTPEKYDVLMNEILLINFDTNNTELLNEIIRCVFECAVTQTSLSNMYADLCKDLTQKFAQAQKSKETEESGRSAYASFRRALLNKCQTEFEKPQTIPASSNLSKEERDEAESKLRQRQLGNIKFIGELFKRKMLTEKIMHEVIKRLLLGCPPKEDHVPSDEEIEVLCKLLTTVGIMLDRQQAHTYMNHYFEKMKKLLTNHPRQRIRFMLQDVIELRDMNWVPRREEQKPQTLSELENTMHRKQMEAQEQLSRPRINPVPNHIPANPTFSPTQLSPNNSPPPPAASSPIHQPSSPPQAKPPPLASTPKPKPEPTRKPQLAKPEPLPPTAAPAANPPKQSAVAPNTKTEKEPSAVNTVPHEVSKPQPKPKPKASEEEPVAPKLMDELALESAAHSLLEEFKNSTQESDLYDNLRQVGESNHLNLFRKAIEGSTTSLARHSTERKLLAGLLRQILQHEDESGAHKPLVSPKVIYGSFTAFVQHALDPEDGLLEDNPKLWECFADLLVQCFLENTFTYAALNYLIADDLFQHEQFLPFILALFRRLKQERNATLICCSGHFEILQKLFCATRTTERIEELLQNFQSSDLLEVDVTIYLYYCYKSRVPVDDILIRLQSRIPESLSTSSVISQKVASPTILYSAVATNLFVEASKKPEPRVLFSKLVELFNNQLTKPILKYTQNDSVDKLDNELQCLIEAQKFCYLTGYQGGILCNYFQVFYEVEVVMEDTYYMWRKQTNADYGKDQAVKEVQSFLSFLEKGDEEAGDDADAYDGAE